MNKSSELSLHEARRAVFILMLVHLLAWTLMPILARGTVHTDTLESIAWGLQWQWGYDKHPFLAGWISAFVTSLAGGTVGWPVYWVGTCNILVAFVVVWSLARRLLQPAQAVLSVCLLETIWYYNLLGPKFDPNTLMISLWALTIWLAYFSLEKLTDWRWWILTGFMAGLAFLAKYQSALLWLSLLLAMLSTDRGRQAWKTVGPYLALVTLIITISPNLYWLSQHEFISWQYAAGRIGGDLTQRSFSNHWVQPFRFLTQQLGTLAIFLIALGIIYRYPKVRPMQSQKVPEWSKRFLLIVGLGPVVISLMISLLGGLYLYAKWAAPYFFLFGLLAILIWQPRLSAQQAKRWVLFSIAVTLSLALGRGIYLTYFPLLAKDHYIDAFYPYAAIAEETEHQWSRYATTPLQFVAGNHYLAAGLGVYIPSHPRPYMDWDLKQSPWIDETALERQGAMFVWDIDQRPHATPGLNPEWLDRYPDLKWLGIKVFHSTNPRQHHDFSIAFAVLSPRLVYNAAPSTE